MRKSSLVAATPGGRGQASSGSGFASHRKLSAPSVHAGFSVAAPQPSSASGSGGTPTTPVMLRRRSSNRRGSQGTIDANLLTLQAQAARSWSNAPGTSIGLFPCRQFIGPLLFVTLGPLAAFLIYHTLTKLDGSFVKLWTELSRDGLVSGSLETIPRWNTTAALGICGSILVSQLLLLILLPGKRILGPITPAGEQQVYKINAVACWLMTGGGYLMGVYLGLYKGGYVYSHLGECLACITFVLLPFCALLAVKGVLLPSTADYGSSQNPLFDFFWGTELHPRLLMIDVKRLLVGRVAPAFWTIILLSAGFRQVELYRAISGGLLMNILLQLLYIGKYAVCEACYLHSLDMMHERAGFYLLWHSVILRPVLALAPTIFIVGHPSKMKLSFCAGLIVLGLICLYTIYAVDTQRRQFRVAGGNLKIWALDPYFINAKYRPEHGDTRVGLILGSGWWGKAQHFHYVPEFLLTLCWTVPVWNASVFLPYLYLPYLFLFLLDRVYRDDARCRSKYGRYWETYCARVPFKVLPSVF